jgi:hypothetical protein
LTHFKLLEASPVAFLKAGSVKVSDGSYWKRPDYVPAIEASCLQRRFQLVFPNENMKLNIFLKN